ncbi:salivary peroxidase/catechol oxidase-like [Diadema antillarum]|uniref:salivary peroxidase/catechol oxidase-like n=1 Tax=Diadema antillarum TaxID=105358 RepID=UPI003A85585A
MNQTVAKEMDIPFFSVCLVGRSLSFVHHRPTSDSFGEPSLDEITRQIEHSTKWVELREKIYLRDVARQRNQEYKRTPEYLHQKFSKMSKRSKRFAMVARIAENITEIFGERQITSVAPNSLPELCRMAGFNYTFKDCPRSTRLRTFNGACNNLVHVNVGKAFSPFQRFLPPDFADGIKTIRRSVTGASLPGARTVSSNIIHFEHVFVPDYTAIIAHFGQFLDHDVGHSGTDTRECEECLESDFCMPIMTEQPDTFFSRRCIPFVRSVPSPGVDCQPGPRQQLNQVTSFVDGSQIYGSSKAEADFLRDKTRGRGQLRSLTDPISPDNLPLLPLDEEHRDCIFERVDRKCGLSGDERAAEQPVLTALHTMFLRMHNDVASRLANINPSWDDERLYQEARRIVVASWQHIVYNEYLPTLLGRSALIANGLRVHPTAQFFGYDVDVNPSVSNVFASSAFRMGHSQVPPNFTRLDANYREVFPPIPTGEVFFNASHVYDVANGGLDSLIRGMTQQLVAKVDGYITVFLTRHLFADPAGSEGLDLGAVNVQRGRDHGLPAYNAWRQWCGLRRARSFNDLANEFEAGALVKFQRTYRHVDDIDLFVAAISERPVRGGLMGPTLSCIIGQQFQRLKFGDRFWYENANGEQAFTLDQLQEIRKVTMARIICNYANGMRTIHSLVFRSPDQGPAPPGAETSFYKFTRQHKFPDIDGTLPGFANIRVSCRNEDVIPNMSLEPWREEEQGKRDELVERVLNDTPDTKDTPRVEPKKAPWWYRKPGPDNQRALDLLKKLRSPQGARKRSP